MKNSHVISNQYLYTFYFWRNSFHTKLEMFSRRNFINVTEWAQLYVVFILCEIMIYLKLNIDQWRIVTTFLHRYFYDFLSNLHQILNFIKIVKSERTNSTRKQIVFHKYIFIHILENIYSSLWSYYKKARKF